MTTIAPITAPLPQTFDVASIAPQISALTDAITNLSKVVASLTPAAGSTAAGQAAAGTDGVSGGGGVNSAGACSCCSAATSGAVNGTNALGANAAPTAAPKTVTAGGAATVAPAPTAAPVAPVVDKPKEKSAAEKVVDYAKGALGKPYVFGAAGPDSYDCSGLTLKALEQAGVTLPHSASAQMNKGTEVSKNDLKPGDLLFFDGGGHSAVYIGDGKLIHAPTPGKNVEEKPFTGWYQEHFTKARRFI